MSELQLPPEEIIRDIRNYSHTVFGYAYSKAIPDDLLRTPDHVLIKTPNPADFQYKYEEIKDWTDRRYFLEINDRFLVAAKLIIPLALSDKKVGWIEVMEAKSPEGTADYLGAEYVEFLYPDYHKASDMLFRNRVHHTHREDDNHRWINIRLNNDGQELHITDKPLEATIDYQVDTGSAKPIID